MQVRCNLSKNDCMLLCGWWRNVRVHSVHVPCIFVEIYLFKTPLVRHIYGFSRSFRNAILTELHLSICDDCDNGRKQAAVDCLLRYLLPVLVLYHKSTMSVLGTLGSGLDLNFGFWFRKHCRKVQHIFRRRQQLISSVRHQ